jgi:lysozyme family protein
MAANSFEPSLAHVLKHEGGYVNHPADPGGATNLGITAATLAQARGHPVSAADVAALTRAEAAAIYRRLFWNPARSDDLPAGLDHAVFDLAVNSGPGRAARLLQRVLAVAEDGVIGPATLAAAQRAEPRQAIRALQRERLAFLKRLSTWPAFGRGWQARVAAVEREALALAAEAATPPVPRPTPKPTPVPSPPQKGPIMNDAKSILASRTVWANLVGLASVGLTLAGVDTGDLDVNRVAESAAQLVAAASFIGSTVFRIAATRRLIG